MGFRFAVLLLFSLLACKSTKTTVKETESKNILLRPRIVMADVPGVSVKTTTVIECDSVTNKPKDTSFNGQSNGAHSKGVLKDGVLTTVGGCDSLQRALTVYDSIITVLRSKETTKEKSGLKWSDYLTLGLSGIGLLAIGFILGKFLA